MSILTNLFGATLRYAKFHRSQYWEPERLQAYRKDLLQKTLIAATRIPFYASRFEGTCDLKDFPGLPCLKRSEVSKLNQSVRSLYPPTASFPSDCSSGSTGMPIEVLFDASHQRGRYAARIRYLRQNGWSPLQRNAWIIYLPERTPDGYLIQSRARLASNFLSIFTDFAEQVAWLRRVDPLFLYTIPSNLEALLDLFEASGQRLPSLKRLFTGGEVLEDDLRSRAHRVLGVEVSDNYGTTEAFLAWECPEGSYHINSEHVLLEVVDEAGRPVAPGKTGKVLVTTLENYLMPLVRYEIGDYAVAAEENCPCGRNLPLLKSIVGRSINFFRLKDGRLVSPWELVVRLKYRPELRQFQIIQETVDRYELHFVAESPLTPESQAQLRRFFHEVLDSDVTVEFMPVEKIPRTPSGKFMTALSRLSDRPRSEQM
ncbi:MAG: phenylacetate--CoA ligase family protein [Deltaproteobacteria bacterium]|nr:MAG: phenylacetate--CoA ligase family protein [Deltaproteobacteria bacterium]